MKRGMKYACVIRREQNHAQELASQAESPARCPSRPRCLEESLVPDWPGNCLSRSQGPNHAGLPASLPKGFYISLSQHDILQNILASKSFKFLLYIRIQDLKIQTNHAWGSISYSNQPEQKFHSLQPSSSDWHKVHGWLALLFIFLKSEYSSHIMHVYKKNIDP